MFLQGGGKSGSLSNRIAKLQNDFPESGIFLLFAQAIQSLWNGDCRPQQRSHLTRERSDFLSLDSLPIADVQPHGRRHRRSGGGSFVSGSTDFEVRRKQAALSQEMERRLSVLSLDHTLDGGAAQLDCLVSKRVHSNKSPEDTRMISSRLVIPSAAFCKASWCSVLNTWWPVSAARIAISAVSESRISPTITTSGSCRSIERRPFAKVKFRLGRTGICATPGSSYSTGSSMVRIFSSGV